MSLVEGLLIVIVIVLTIMVVTSACRKDASTTRAWDCVDRATGDVTTVKMETAVPRQVEQMTPERKAQFENAEYFNGVSCQKDDCEDIDQTVASFGKAGSFVDWVASQAVDGSVMKNHMEFVKDRLSTNTENITGKTFAMGEIEASESVPWQGIRGRPQAIPTSALAGSLQVPDVNPNNYTSKPRFNWTSS
ncbi:Hypothetical protein PACV_248 [Pacmanvirus A23]|uniref:Hypothetical protein n=1 Tax=Pacmanvirus A23 TaxID=1932881 RepID=UPI000A0952A8|nr:Hypothetical protein B9W72_gp246 [Pacmanvirus A23]SIP85963.1 Hypothetical protein PACV_248 [Pacmanvirus A23]